MPLRLSRVFAVCAALIVATTSAIAADALIKPLPTPDLSRLEPARAEEVTKARVEFEKVKTQLVGDKLAEAYALIGSAYASNGFYDAAAAAIEDAMLLAPKDGRWVYLQGVLARAQHRDAIAQNYFDLAYGLDRDYLPIRITAARTKLAAGDVEGARKLLAESVSQHADEAVPHALLGEIALRQKRYPEAIEQTRRALALQPNATALYTTLGEAQAAAGDANAAAVSRAKAGNAAPMLADPLAEGFLGRAASAAPAAAATSQPTEADMAVLALANHQYDVARQQLDIALKRDPKNAVLLALYARVEGAAGNLAAARSRASQAVAADPKSAVAHLSLGVALEMASDDAGAQRAYEQAIGDDATLAEPRQRLGMLLMRTGRLDDAIAQFRALVRLDITNQESWIRLVAANVTAGKCANALRDVSDALAANANNAPLLQIFVRLASTCPGATADQRRGALEYGRKLYADGTSAAMGEAYALALAANGKWDDAVKTQQAAMFVLVRNGQKAGLATYQEVLKQLQQHALPRTPWVTSAWMFHPARPAPEPKGQPRAAAGQSPSK